MKEKRLKNPSIILVPITESEKEIFNSEVLSYKDVFVLYKLNEEDGIRIGMLSSAMRNTSLAIANITKLPDAIKYHFFYSPSVKINDRPLYKINISDERKVDSYEILNDYYVSLDDVLNGNYTIENEQNVLKRS